MKALTSMLLPLLGLFATLPLNGMIVDTQFFVVLGLFLLLTLVHEPIMWRVLFVATVVYTFVFARLGLQLIPAFILLLTFRARKVPTVLKTLLFLVAVSVSSNALSPALVVAYVVLVHHEKLMHAWSVLRTRVLVLLLLTVLFLPLPELGLSDYLNRLSSQQSISSQSEYRGKEEISGERPQVPKENSQSAGTKRASPETVDGDRSLPLSQLSDFLFKLSIFMSSIALVLLVLWFLVYLKREGVPLTELFVWSFTRFVLITTLFSLLYAFVLPPLLSYVEASLVVREVKRPDVPRTTVENGDASIGRPQSGLESTEGSRKEGGAETSATTGSGWLKLLFLTLGVVVSGVVILSLSVKIVELLRIPTSTESENKAVEEKTSLRFNTTLTYDEILSLSGRHFVEHAYLFIRKTFFPRVDHLTPYELLEKVSHEQKILREGPEQRVLPPKFLEKFSRLTNGFVESRYAGISMNYKEKDIGELKIAFIALCDGLRELQEAK